MSFPQLIADVTASVETTAQATSTASTAPSDPISFQTALLVIIAGALIFLAKNLANLNSRLGSLEAGRNPPKRSNSGASAPLASGSNSSGVPAEIVAAISAAVHTTLKGRLRILSVGQICPSRQAWSAEGRRQVFSSHKVR